MALSEDVYLALPADLRERCVYLGTTTRDGTLAFVYPRAAASRRDPARFIPTDQDLVPAERRFVRYVDGADVRRLRYVGFRLSRREPPSLDILDVFTPLDVEDHAREALVGVIGPPASDRSLPGRAEEFLHAAPWGRRSSAAPTPRPFKDVIRERKHVVVLGDPGSGKSTLLRWLAVTAAAGRTVCRERLGIDERLLPILVSVSRLFELRQALAAAGGDSAAPSGLDAMVRYFHERNAGEDASTVRDLLRRRLEGGGCLVLLDGLDEVPTERRAEVAAWTEGFASAYRENRFVVTSRVFGFAGLDLPGGATVVVQPFTDAQIRAYLIAWHRAYRTWEGNLTREAGAIDAPLADAEARRLIDVLVADPRLHGLAANPFLLSAMALVHRAEGQLPANRVQLYEIFARALCETWSAARRLVAGDAVAVPRLEYESEAIPILGRLAFWLHEHHPAGAAPEELVREEIARALVEESGGEEGQADRAAREFLRRAGEEIQILIPRGSGLFGFLHLTFQEFFAAAYLHAVERFEREAKRRWHDPRWEEVILLGVGTLAVLQKRVVAAARLVRDTLRWTVPGYPFVTTILEKQVLLAAKSCADAPNLPADVYATVAGHLIRLLVEEPIDVKRERARQILPRLRGTRFGEVVFDELVSIVRSGSEYVQRSRAAEALADLSDPRARESLVNALQADREPAVRAAAASALAALRDATALEPLVTALEIDQSDAVRSNAANALAALGNSAALAALLAALERDQSADVRSSTARALGAIGDRGALEPLFRALHDPEPSVRAAAAEAGGRLGESRAAEHIRTLFWGDASPSVRSSAAGALVALHDAHFLESLLRTLDDGQDEMSRRAVIEALRWAPVEGRFERLSSIIRTDESGSVRGSAALILGELRDPRAIPSLVEALERDEAVSVRMLAAVAVGLLGDRDGSASLLTAARKDSEEVVRVLCAEALAWIGDMRAASELLTSLRIERSPCVRAAMLATLGALGYTRAVPALLTGLTRERDAWRRDQIVRGLWNLSERLPMSGGKPRRQARGRKR
ncbi:MAG: HEAT repeat domain-containing protein [Candidatus Rokubacteria bacterium]|nr:HEAT repeat domain-containing protein [Candidatus Rokubacteria bacterium]